ncbi:MAG: hypothetical protein K6T86_18925 [Pirellulales bacterium]|nr:hypothetical protein [Pirellulales bacterium]
MYDFLRTLDRRWIFLLVLLAISVPILLGLKFPETPTEQVRNAFEEVERLKPGSRVLLSFDYDPASEGELGPMATAFVRHCCQKRLRMYFMALWPIGPQMADDTIDRVIHRDFPDLQYGRDYVNLGFKPGNEGVIKVIVTDLRQLYTTDARGTNIDRIPMCAGIRTVRDFDLIINVSAGYAGTKEWVQYAASPYPKEVRLIAGCTGVQAPLMYPYIPDQLRGMLGAIKGAAEYEALLLEKQYIRPDEVRYQEGLRRMGPQFVGHILMIALIVLGNVLFVLGRRRERVR